MASTLYSANPDAALAVHALLKAGHELGPERDPDLVALYLDQQAERSPRRSAPTSAAILRPGVVPAQVLGGQLALAAATEYLVQLSAPEAMGYQKVADAEIERLMAGRVRVRPVERRRPRVRVGWRSVRRQGRRRRE